MEKKYKSVFKEKFWIYIQKDTEQLFCSCVFYRINDFSVN